MHGDVVTYPDSSSYSQYITCQCWTRSACIEKVVLQFFATLFCAYFLTQRTHQLKQMRHFWSWVAIFHWHWKRAWCIDTLTKSRPKFIRAKMKTNKPPRTLNWTDRINVLFWKVFENDKWALSWLKCDEMRHLKWNRHVATTTTTIPSNTLRFQLCKVRLSQKTWEKCQHDYTYRNFPNNLYLSAVEI